MRSLSRLSTSFNKKPPVQTTPDALKTLTSPRSCNYSTEGWDKKTGAPSEMLLAVGAHWHSEDRFAPTTDYKIINSLPTDAKVLEFGPGIGNALGQLKRAVPQGMVVAVEKDKRVKDSLELTFGGGNLRLVEGERLRDAGVAPKSQDYIRTSRVMPYQTEVEWQHFFEDASELIKEDGKVYVTAYHSSQTEVEYFRTQTLAELVRIGNAAGLTPTEMEIAIVAPGATMPLETFKLDAREATSARLEALDDAIASRRSAHHSDVEVEMRLLCRTTASQQTAARTEE
jgi:hypothetical protein